MENFYIIVTNAGLAKIAEATANQTTVKLTEMAVGDSNGNYYEPQASQTTLRNEKWRGSINKLEIDSNNSQQVKVQSLIPADIGGFTIREVGVFDESGILIAVGKFPETEKVLASQGASRELYLQVIMKVSNTSSIVLQVDPNLVMVTQSYVDNKLNDKADKQELDEHKTEYAKLATDVDTLKKLKKERSNKDSYGNFTTVTYKRKSDGTIYAKSVLSGGTAPQYTTRTETFYDVDGTTVLATIPYTISYDSAGDWVGEA